MSSEKAEKSLSHILLITDMDDTLLSSDKTISQENLNAIYQFRKLGGLFTVATGRSIPSYLPYLEQLQISIPVVLNNGAVLYHPQTGKIIWNSILPKEAKQYVSQTVAKFPSVGAEVLLGEDIYIIHSNEQVQEHMQREHLTHLDVPADQIPDDWFKVLYAMEPEELPIFYDYVIKENHSGVCYVTSSSRYCEMLPDGVSKGKALQVLIQLYGLQQHKVYAVGDYYNDLSLIKNADVGAAVENAPEDVKNCADLVLPTNDENAIAKLIYYIMEHEMK
jgi:Cof subfamily protein (haloacid dehalogenase superfamily)